MHSGDGETALLDASMLRHIVSNLISNAIKYSPAESEISVSSDRNGSRLQLSVTDSGIGIPEEEHENLFRLFFRSTNATNIQGTGLGLNIVKRYVELMNGRIEFTSKLNVGTTFLISFDET